MDVKNGIKRGICAAAAVMCLGWPFGGRAEGSWQQTMKYGKVAAETWTESDGTAAPGPEGYTTVTYSYEKNETTEKYFDESGNPG